MMALIEPRRTFTCFHIFVAVNHGAHDAWFKHLLWCRMVASTCSCSNSVYDVATTLQRLAHPVDMLTKGKLLVIAKPKTNGERIADDAPSIDGDVGLP